MSIDGFSAIILHLTFMLPDSCCSETLAAGMKDPSRELLDDAFYGFYGAL